MTTEPGCSLHVILAEMCVYCHKRLVTRLLAQLAEAQREHNILSEDWIYRGALLRELEREVERLTSMIAGVVTALGYDLSIKDAPCDALAHSVQALVENYERLGTAHEKRKHDTIEPLEARCARLEDILSKLVKSAARYQHTKENVILEDLWWSAENTLAEGPPKEDLTCRCGEDGRFSHIPGCPKAEGQP